MPQQRLHPSLATAPNQGSSYDQVRAVLLVRQTKELGSAFGLENKPETSGAAAMTQATRKRRSQGSADHGALTSRDGAWRRQPAPFHWLNPDVMASSKHSLPRPPTGLFPLPFLR